MFKKMLVIMMVLGLVFAGSSMACQECQGDGSTVSGYYDGQALEWAMDYDHSGVNDFAFVKSGTMIGGTMSTFADAEGYSYERVFSHWDYEWKQGCFGIRYKDWYPVYETIEIPNEASQEGDMLFVAFDGNVHACSFDGGLFSHSFAKAELGDVLYIVKGEAEGVGGLNESVSLTIRYGGQLFQETLAQEVGYNAGYVIAQEQSGLSFLSYMPTIYDSGIDEASIFRTNFGYSPFEAVTKGGSTVEIDPYGNTRSIHANTWNQANISVNNCFAPASMSSNVGGVGHVEGFIQNGSSFAGGMADFNYVGSMNGNGAANLDAMIKNGQNSTTVIINGSSNAVADGVLSNMPN